MKNIFNKIAARLFGEFNGIPPLLAPAFLPGLNGLRGISILFVLFGHFSMTSRFESYFSGSIGVWIFFVISGFLITTLLIKEKIATGHISLRRFYIRRLLRIMPVAYLFLITLSVLNHFLKMQIPFHAFLSAGLFVQNLPRINSYNWYVQHFWSLSVEEQFYLTFPFLLVYNTNWYIKCCLLLVFVVPVIEFLGFNNIGVFYTVPQIHLFAFVIINLLGNLVYIAIGSLFSIFLFKGIIIINDTHFFRYLSIPLFLIAISISTQASPFFMPYAQLFIFPVLIAFTIVLNLNDNSIMAIILNNRVLNYIGTLSYSIYIWQQLFCNKNIWLVKIDSVLVHVILIFLVAMISYHFYEKAFLKLKNKFKQTVRI